MVLRDRILRLCGVTHLGLRPALLAAALITGAHATFAADPGVFNIRDYGAVGDGKADETEAINKAVNACAAAGGGQVRFPPGTFLSGTVRLKSNVTLYFDAGARLVGSTDLDRYQNFHPPAGTFESRHLRWHRALILGEGVENVGIAGSGVIDGNKVFDPKGEERMRGPHTILLGKCRNATIRSVSIRDSANYAILLEWTDRVEIRDLRITGGWDAVHFRDCRDVTITGSEFFTGDDCIAGRHWNNVLISDCVINSSCNGIRLIGPATNLIIHDCLFYGPGLHPHRTSDRHNMLAGINLQPGAWGATKGSLDDVLISNITMKNVLTPLHVALRPGNTGGNIDVSRLTAVGVYGAAASVESWDEAAIKRVVLRDVAIEYAGGGTAEQASRKVGAPTLDARKLPAWGFYARNVKDLRFEGVRLNCNKDDLRSVMICDGVERLTLDNLRFPRFADAGEPLVLNNVDKVERDTTAPRRTDSGRKEE